MEVADPQALLRSSSGSGYSTDPVATGTEQLDPNRRPIPDEMLEALSRNFCREATGYGFSQVDFLRYINLLMDAAVAGRSATTPTDGVIGAAPEATPPLRGERVAIRAFDNDHDLPLLRRWLEDPSGRFFLLSRSGSGDGGLEALLSSPENRLGTVTSSDGAAVGVVAYLDVDRRHRKAELRKLIGEPGMRGRGLAKEAARLWIRYGLDTLGLRKIYLNTTHTNLRNVRINEELGFRVEGILRNEIRVDGVHHDVLRMGLWHGDAEDAQLETAAAAQG